MKRSSYRERDYAFGQMMLTLRTATSLTQTALADYLGVTRFAVGEWESGQKYPKADHLKQFIALALERRAFAEGREAEEIRALWTAARQKVLLDEHWLATLLAQAAPSVELPALISAGTVTAPLSREKRSHGFPFQPTNFVGRGAELGMIARILRDPTCRLLTLLGPGGVGKTRLALEAAASHTDAYLDGVAFVALAPVSSASQIVSAIGDTLNLSFGNEPDPVQHLLAYLSERHLLPVLDNFEHLLDGAALVYDILERAPRVTLLITSRERLNLRAEWLFDVQGLPYPPVDTSGTVTSVSMASLSAYSAVQLFIQRATQVYRGFPLSEPTLRTIVSICQHVAGLPLAIELAAASVRVLAIADIDRQISSNLDALATTLRDVPARHRSLRAVFDHSWNLLSGPEHAPFTRLAVFRGGFTAHAAEAVAGATLPVLLALVDKSLVRQSNPQSGAGDTPRFFLLEPIREYALQKLDGQEADALSRLHARYYLTMAETAHANWETPRAEAALEEIDLELDNMRAALQWSVRSDPILGLRLVEALMRYWRSRVYLDEARQWLEPLLAVTEGITDHDTLGVRMHAIEQAAWLATDQHNFAFAAELFRQSMAIRRALGEPENETNLRVNEALKARVVGQYSRATALLEAAVARHRTLGDRGTLSSGGIGYSIYFLALFLREQGDFTRAAALFEECVVLHRELGDREGMAQGLLGLSDIARDVGTPAELRRYCGEALATYREFGTQWAIGFCLNNLAFAAYLENDLTEAFALVSESVSMFRAQKSPGSIAEVLVTLGVVLVARGDLDGAYTALSESIGLAWVTGPRLLIAAALEALGCALAPRGRVEAGLAVGYFAAAALLRQEMGTSLRPADQPAYNHALATARATLGAGAYADAWAVAQRLPLEVIMSQFVDTK